MRPVSSLELPICVADVPLQAIQMKPMIVAQNGSAATQTVKTLGSKAATGR